MEKSTIMIEQIVHDREMKTGMEIKDEADGAALSLIGVASMLELLIDDFNFDKKNLTRDEGLDIMYRARLIGDIVIFARDTIQDTLDRLDSITVWKETTNENCPGCAGTQSRA